MSRKSNNDVFMQVALQTSQQMSADLKQALAVIDRLNK